MPLPYGAPPVETGTGTTVLVLGTITGSEVGDAALPWLAEVMGSEPPFLEPPLLEPELAPVAAALSV